MKKIFLISVIFFTALANQSQPVFEIIIDQSSGDRFYDMILTSDSCLLIYGSKGNWGEPSSHAVLIKTNLSGQIIWQKNYYPNWTGGHIIESPTGFYYLAGALAHQPFLIKINAAGDSLWSKTWPADPNQPQNFTTLKQMSENRLLLSRQYNNIYGQPPTSAIMIIDTLGNQICMDSGTTAIIAQTNILNTNNYLYIGREPLEPVILIRKNLFCGTISSFYYNSSSYPTDLNIDEEGNIYFTRGSAYDDPLVKINDSGDLIWSANLLPGENLTPNSMVIEGDKIILTGSVFLSGEGYPFFISVCDTSGSVDTVYTDQTYYAQVGNKLIRLGDDLFIAGTLRIEAPPEYNSDIFLSKYSLSSLTTSINTHNPTDKSPISVFPNPANDKVIFESSETSSFVIASGSKILITNSYGQPITQIPVTSSKTFFDCRPLPPGIYFYQFQTTAKNYSGKFLIIK